MPVPSEQAAGILLRMKHYVPACLLTILLLPGGGVAAAEPAAYFPPGIELPAGTGRELVLRACTRCHDLKGVPAFKGYWTQSQWLAMTETMIKHGARLNADEAQQVAHYLATHFGRPPASSP